MLYQCDKGGKKRWGLAEELALGSSCPNWREGRKGAGTDVQLVRGGGQGLWKSPSDLFQFHGDLIIMRMGQLLLGVCREGVKNEIVSCFVFRQP